MRPARFVGVVLLLVAASGSLTAAGAQPWPGTVGCTLAANTNPLQVTLPDTVLDHLESISASPFVHAYLIRYVGAEAAGGHRLSQCARAFTKAELRDVATLRGMLPDAAEIIRALRDAGETRRRLEELGSTEAADNAADLLRQGLSAAALATYLPGLQADEGQRCRGTVAGACGALGEVVSLGRALREARGSAEALEGRLRLSTDAMEGMEQDLQASAARGATDSLALADAVAADPPPAEESLAPLRERLDAWEARHRRLAAQTDSARDSLASLVREHQSAADSVTGLERKLRGELGRFGEEVAKLSVRDPLRANRVTTSSGAKIALPPTEIKVPDLAAGAPAPAAQSANLLLALTDFILARARREAVNSFIINLHFLASRERLLQFGFPDTWGLLSSISTRSDGALDAVEVGRIPLGVWRATLAGDFVTLPVNLVAQGPERLCQDSDTTVVARSQRLLTDGERRACRQRAAELAPLVKPAGRLLRGEPVLDVLLDAASFAAPGDTVLPSYWRHVSQGLGILASFARTFDEQGYARNADPTAHPYYLSARSLLQVPREQQAAFARLLLVRAVPTAEALPARVDTASFHAAITSATRLFERLMALGEGADSLRRDPGQVLRSSFEILATATDFARPLVDTSQAVRIDSIRARWQRMAAAIQPLFAGDFGLALSRTVVLLRNVRGADVPAPVMTFSALASALSEARTGQQIQAAFEVAASPVGGWQSKRYGDGVASLTAFPGAAAGWEHVIRREDDPDELGTRAGSVGASLPIGFEIQFKRPSDSPAAQPGCFVCGVGFFLPLIDVGALLSYRISGPDEVESEPNASLRQVFAPGAYLSLPLTRKVPLTLLIGGQLMPSLRTVETPEGDERRSAFRYGISLGMDVMLRDF